VYRADNLRVGDVLKMVNRKLEGEAGKSAKDLFRVLNNIRLLRSTRLVTTGGVLG
jgi:hypothetical protein